MKMILWIAVAVVFLIVSVISYLRLKRPHSKRKVAEQEKLNKKTGATHGTIAAQKTENGKGERGSRTKLGWNLLLIVIGTVVLFLSAYSSKWRNPSLADVGSWGQNHWLPLLILWGIGAVLIALNAESLGTAKKTLQGVLAGIVFMLLVGFPTWSWISGPSGTPATGNTPQAGAKEFTQTLPRSAPEFPLAKDLKQEEWPQLVLPAGGESERIRVPYKKRLVMFGKDFRVHCVYRDGHEIDFGEGEEPCPEGDMPYVYVTNEAEVLNMISYAYAPIGSS